MNSAREIFDPKVYWENRLSDSFNLHGVGFKGLGNSFNHWFYKIKRKVFRKHIKSLRLNLPEIKVLDVGSGTGFFIDLWCELGVKHISGLDITETAVSKLRKKYPEKIFFRADISEEKYVLKGQQYDVVSAFDVLFHIVDDDKYKNAIKNIADLIKPGGYLIFSDNFLHGETFRTQHQVCHTLNNIEEILAKAGFDIIKRKPMCYFMNYPIDSEKVIFKKVWSLIQKNTARGEKYGNRIGAILYPIESLAIRIFRESPTTEIMICRKK
ncbi:MAG: class I SAM-dependent methyltransferase [Firmicutes bacterium]|nr:class I SAM-dependent methyltransferase [Bacillota bacterium]